jgi:pSer/pThr/pTyr-binding forkhead associated (FHA) protein
MKVQLIVVQGKPEGKMIPLIGPRFKIGRGETCNLRPNSEQVSREHAEFQVMPDKVTVRDLGSRNGTLVNGKALTEPCTLKDRDLIQIGPLTFAISIQEVAAPAPKGPAPVKAKAASPDDVSHADIESWLISDSTCPTPAGPSAVYGGDTLTISAYKTDKPSTGGTDKESETKDEVETVSDDETAEEPETPEEEEPIDETNPGDQGRGRDGLRRRDRRGARNPRGRGTDRRDESLLCGQEEARVRCQGARQGLQRRRGRHSPPTDGTPPSQVSERPFFVRGSCP